MYVAAGQRVAVREHSCTTHVCIQMQCRHAVRARVRWVRRPMRSDAVQARGACTCEVGQTTHEMGTQLMGSLCELSQAVLL
jgi:hypothetical protein